MEIPFDTTDKALRMEITRNVIKSIHKQAAELKTGDPHKEPPVIPPLNRNPRKHNVVAWRNDGRLDATSHDTKEAAQEYGRGLCFAVYYQYAIMDGRDMIEKHAVAIPDGMGLDDNGLPIKL